MKYTWYVLVLFTMASCQYFETDKISSDTFYKEEIKTISWNDVDQFPNFNSCQDTSGKMASKACFENTLISKIYAGFSAKHFVSIRTIKDTLWVAIAVSQTGNIAVNAIEMDSITALTFPDLSTWIRQSVDSIAPVAPAHKRGVPVAVAFKLPVVLQTK
tara:strand:+ start:196 stop:672 length:477 start_codon:yes stop_codon:yes gene_type:complete